mgnify:CR=1 FL=1|jgi:hypothetical protein
MEERIEKKYKAHKLSFLFFEESYNRSHIPVIGLNLLNSMMLATGNMVNNQYSKYFLLTGSMFSIVSTTITSYYALYQLGDKKNSFFNSKNELKRLKTKIILQKRINEELDEKYIHKKLFEIEAKNKYLIPNKIYNEIFLMDETSRFI